MRIIFILLFVLMVGCVPRIHETIVIETYIQTEFNRTQENEIKNNKETTQTIQNPKEERYITVGDEQRKLPHQVGEKWVYTNIKTGQPINPSYKLRID